MSSFPREYILVSTLKVSFMTHIYHFVSGVMEKCKFEFAYVDRVFGMKYERF